MRVLVSETSVLIDLERGSLLMVCYGCWTEWRKQEYQVSSRCTTDWKPLMVTAPLAALISKPWRRRDGVELARDFGDQWGG
jgi:hypothetical protein